MFLQINWYLVTEGLEIFSRKGILSIQNQIQDHWSAWVKEKETVNQLSNLENAIETMFGKSYSLHKSRHKSDIYLCDYVLQSFPQTIIPLIKNLPFYPNFEMVVISEQAKILKYNW